MARHQVVPDCAHECAQLHFGSQRNRCFWCTNAKCAGLFQSFLFYESCTWTCIAVLNSEKTYIQSLSSTCALWQGKQSHVQQKFACFFQGKKRQTVKRVWRISAKLVHRLRSRWAENVLHAHACTALLCSVSVPCVWNMIENIYIMPILCFDAWLLWIVRVERRAECCILPSIQLILCKDLPSRQPQHAAWLCAWWTRNMHEKEASVG